VFQSLIGELKTGDLDVDTNLNVDGFQSLIGELKTEIDDKVIRYETFLFQSLIGELKTPYATVASSGIEPFQSLIGELKTHKLFKKYIFFFWGVKNFYKFSRFF